MHDLIPDPVFVSIQNHLVRVGNHAESGWEGGSADEDTLTGDLGAQLRTNWTTIKVGRTSWRWRVRYKKFRGKGPGAFETRAGADGIVQAEVLRGKDQVELFKGLLFQAKKGRLPRSKTVLEQVQKMENIAPGSSAVFEYSSEGYRAVDGRDYLSQPIAQTERGKRTPTPLGSYLGDLFLPCKSGLRGMYYDAERELLLVPRQGELLAMRVELGHRISLRVQEESSSSRG
jgi:hypothetical protein